MDPTALLKLNQTESKEFYSNLLLLFSRLSLTQLSTLSSLVSQKLSQLIALWDKPKYQQLVRQYLPLIMNILYSRIQSEQKEKFSLIHVVLQKYIYVTSKKLELSSLEDSSPSLCENDKMQKRLKFILHSKSQASIKNVNRMINSLIKHDCFYPDSCLTCGQYFYDHWSIKDESRLVSLNKYQKSEFPQHFSSLIGQKEGIILISPKESEKRLTGMIFSPPQRQKIREKMLECQKAISYKGFKIILQFVKVYQDPNLIKNKKTYQKMNKEQRQIPRLKIKRNQLYNKKQMKFSNIPCIQANLPLQFQKQKSFSENKRYFKYDDTLVTVSNIRNPIKFDFENGFPKLNKKYESMIIVRCEKYMKFFNSFLDSLNQEGISYSKMVPFPSLNSERKIRKIFIITHDESFEVLNKIKKRCDRQYYLDFFSISHTIALQSHYNQLKIKLFSQFFQQQFEQTFLMKEKTHKLKYSTVIKRYLVFKRKEQAILSFIYFEHVGIKIRFEVDF